MNDVSPDWDFFDVRKKQKQKQKKVRQPEVQKLAQMDRRYISGQLSPSLLSHPERVCHYLFFFD